jgi:TonB family protein
VIRSFYRCCVFLAATLFVQATLHPQSANLQPATPTSPAKNKITYPDSKSGLKQLASDILKAQKENDQSHAQELLESLVLPNFREWYVENFNESAVAKVVPAYTAGAQHLPAQLANVFLSSFQDGLQNIEPERYENEQSACSSARVFSTMTARRTQIPLYELRFTHGDRFRSVFAFAYVDGTFRLVLAPDFSKPSGHAGDSSASATRLEQHLPVHGTVQAAKLVCKVQPYYPEVARFNRISGTVRFHAIIGTDGSVKQLEVASGPDALASAAREAVSRWLYRPTLFNGEPVEVDTMIDVIFSLNQ